MFIAPILRKYFSKFRCEDLSSTAVEITFMIKYAIS